MSLSRRMAGYRLAGLPISNVSETLGNALDAINQQGINNSNNYSGFNKSYSVPGTGGRTVELGARPTGRLDNRPTPDSSVPVFGNAEQVEQLLSPDSPGAYELVWNVGNQYGGTNLTPAQDARIAREAARRWPALIKEMPEGAVVINHPVGGMNQDYERADLYSRFGFGPLQDDGAQFGVVRGGRIQPLSPFIPLDDHASHLARRAEAAGDTDTASLIRQELNIRRNTDYDAQVRRAQEELNLREGRERFDNRYDEEYYNDDYDEQYDDPPITRRDLKYRAENFDQSMRNQSAPPEINLRRELNELGYQPEDYQMTGEDIQMLRDRQIELMGLPSRSRDIQDMVEQNYPRSAPQQITAEQLQAMRADDAIGSNWIQGSSSQNSVIRELPLAERPQAVATFLRDENYSRNADGSIPGRYIAKRNLVDINQDPSNLISSVAQEGYTPQDVENFRQWQAQQAMMSGVDQFADPNSITSMIGEAQEANYRMPPPTLNPDGSVASRADTPPNFDARRAARTSRRASGEGLYGQAYRADLSPGTTIEYRRAPQTQEQVDAINELSAIRQNLQTTFNTPVDQSRVNELVATLEDLSYGPAERIRRTPFTELSDTFYDRIERQAIEAEGGRTSPRRRASRSTTPAATERPEYKKAPKDMNINEFLQWEKDNDYISDYSLSDNDRFLQRREIFAEQAPRRRTSYDYTSSNDNLNAPGLEIDSNPIRQEAAQRVMNDAGRNQARYAESLSNRNPQYTPEMMFGDSDSPQSSITRELQSRRGGAELASAVLERGVDQRPQRPRRPGSTSGYTTPQQTDWNRAPLVFDADDIPF